MSNSDKPLAWHVASGDFGTVVLKGEFSASSSRVDTISVFSPGEDRLAEKVRTLVGAQKGRYVRALASFSPPGRFVRLAPVEASTKVKAPNFLTDLMKSACRINPDETEVAALVPSGAHFDPEAPAPKAVLFAGALTKEVSAHQEFLVSCGLYPVSMEIASLCNLASAVKIAAAEGRSGPTLVLELGEDQSHIFIVNSGAVDFTRQIPFGFKSMLPQIQSELGLADESVAKKILWANTFDFTEMAPVLLRKLVKEIQASVGFYEVQTGYATGQILLPDLPSRFAWIASHLARSLSLDLMSPDMERWTEKIGITCDADPVAINADNLCWSVFAQLGNYD